MSTLVLNKNFSESRSYSEIKKMRTGIHTHKISKPSRIILALGSLAIIACFFVPIWEIHLWAPQYPEGLSMYIWHNDISGEVNIINGLNHYIGMKMIKVEMFPEFKILGILIGLYIVWGLIVALSGSFKMLVAYFIADIVFAVGALADFFRWGYDYGHNLNPEAAIQVPGMSYQPPLIGYKTLLNFEAYSGPYTGGWIVVGVGAITFLILFFEWRKRRAHNKKLPHVFSLIAAVLLFTSSGCANKPEAIQFGKDNCDYCQMTIVKNIYGGEILTHKGKNFKFDDAGCLRDFIAEKKIPVADIDKIYFNELNSGTLVESSELILVMNNEFKTPMGSHIVAVKKENASSLLSKTGSTTMDLKTWLN